MTPRGAMVLAGLPALFLDRDGPTGRHPAAWPGGWRMPPAPSPGVGLALRADCVPRRAAAMFLPNTGPRT